MAKRDIILAAIKEGGATKASLMELAEVNDKGLASQLTYLRMTGNYPVVGDDGVYSLTTAEEWEAKRAAGGSSSAPLTPKARFEKAEKRSKRATSAYDSAKAKKEANPEDRLLQLTFIKAEAELEMSEILLGQAQAAYDAAPDEEETEVETDNVPEDDNFSDEGIEEEIGDFEEDLD